MTTKPVNATTGLSGLMQAVLAGATPETAQRGAPRFTVTTEIWQQVCTTLGADTDLAGLWADHTQVHMAIYDRKGGALVVSLDVVDGAFPSVGCQHAPAIRLERTICDLFGYRASGAPDYRAWIDHGEWNLSHPLAREPEDKTKVPPYRFLEARGEGLHEIPVGPVHAGIIEPGHFRFSCAGETIVRLEERFGYTHKGIEKLLEGKSTAEAAPICARISGDSTVAYSLAFARATEVALGMEVPARAHWLRALMAEMERLSHHLGDIGAICNDAAFGLMHAHFGVLREDVLRTSYACFGHRMMMDCVIPGGVTCDLDQSGKMVVKALIEGLQARLPRLIQLYDDTPSLQDRTRRTGILDPVLAARFGAGGFVGRASGRNFDVRRDLAYAPYDTLKFEVPVRDAGDVDSRIWIRILEVAQSLNILDDILRRMPDGPIAVDLPAPETPVEGIAFVEGFRGDIMVWLRLNAEGRIDRCHPRDPSHFQWPLLEAAIEGNIVADFPLCNKSFNCAYSGSEL